MADFVFNDPSTVKFLGDQFGNVHTVTRDDVGRINEMAQKDGLEFVELQQVIEDGEARFRVADWQLSDDERRARDKADREFEANGGVLERITPYVDYLGDAPTMKLLSSKDDASNYLANTQRWREQASGWNQERIKDALEYRADNDTFGKRLANLPKNAAKSAGIVGLEAVRGVVGLGQLVNTAGYYATGGGWSENGVSRWFEGNVHAGVRAQQSLSGLVEDLSLTKGMEDGALKTAIDVTQGVANVAGGMLIMGAANKVGAVSKGAQVVAAPVATSSFASMVGQGVKSLVTSEVAPAMVLSAGDAFGMVQAAALESGASMGEATVNAAAAGAFSAAMTKASEAIGGTFAGGTGSGSRFVNQVQMQQLREEAVKGGGKALLELVAREAPQSVGNAIKRAIDGAWRESVLSGADTWMQFTLMQNAGVEVSDEDKFEAVAASMLFAGIGSLASEGLSMWANRDALMGARQKYAQDRQAQAAEARAASAAGKMIEDGRPGGVKRVEADGSVWFGDGTVVKPDGTMRIVSGEVVDGNGSLITKGPATENATRETLDLFSLIKGGDMHVYDMPIDSLKVNDRIKQFKADGDPKSGVVQPLEGQYMPIPTKPILVMEFRDGSREVVTGRHRLDLAKRNGLEVIPANIIREVDGWTVELAKTMDAYDNILDGQGSDKDFVDFFRKSNVTDAMLKEHRELTARPRQKMAKDVARYGSEELYSFVSAGHKLVTLDVAAAIAQNAPLGSSRWSEQIQRACLRGVLDDGMRAGEAAIYARGLQKAYNDRALAGSMAQLDLFGEDSTFDLSMRLESKFAARHVSEIELDLSSFKQLLGKRGENLTAKSDLLKRYHLKDADDVEAIERVVEKLQQEKLRWQNYHLDPELAKLARDYANKELHIVDVPVETVDGRITSLDDERNLLTVGDEALRNAEIEESLSYGMSGDDTDVLFELREGDVGYDAGRAEYDEVVAQYKGTDQWIKAPNGKPTNLSERQWVQSRTPAFKKFFGDWEALAEIKAMKQRLIDWMSQENFNRAKGKSREEIFEMFGNDLKPIAYIDPYYLQYLSEEILDNRVYSGLGYMIDHAVNHHPEVLAESYSNIQKIINTADEVKLDASNLKRNQSIIFVKYIENKGAVIVSFDVSERGKIVLHKTFFNKLKVGRFKNLPTITKPLEGGISSISPEAKTPADGHLPVLKGTNNVPNFLTPVNPENVSKVVDENGEPLVVYHGSPHKFEAFSSKKMGLHGTSKGKGYYFTPIKDLADGYVEDGGNLYEVFLNIRKPLGYDKRTMTRSDVARLIDAIDRRLESEVGKDMGILMEFGNVHREGRANVLKSATELIDSNESDVDVFSELVTISGNYDVVASVIRDTLGYDGIIPTDTNAEIIALNPDQAKSATDNSGAFNTADNNILREPVAQLDLFADLPEQQRLFDVNRYEGLSPEEAATRQEEDARVDALRPADEPDDVDLSKTWLRKLEPGEQCLIERRFTEDKAFSFTGGEKIESVEDVAYVFRSLEDEAVEHVFLGAVKDGKLHVVHASMGAVNHTVIDPTVLGVMIRRLNPDKVYLVHNHPSGELRASPQDINTLKNLRNQFGDVVSEDGIIIDQRSGSYATFDLKQIKENPGAHAVGLFNAGSGEKRYTTMSPRRGADVPVKVFNFSKRVFNKDFSFKDFRPVVSKGDVDTAYFLAVFASAQRLSAADKLSVFVLNHSSRIVGDFIVTGRDAFEVVDEVSDYVASTGGSKAILFGRMDKEMFGRFAGDVSEAARGRVNVLDVLNFDEYGDSVSARERDMMRSVGGMIPRPAHGIRERGVKTGDFTVDGVAHEPGQQVDVFAGVKEGSFEADALFNGPEMVVREGSDVGNEPVVFDVPAVPGVSVRAADGRMLVTGLDKAVSESAAAAVLDELDERAAQIVMDVASWNALSPAGQEAVAQHNQLVADTVGGAVAEPVVSDDVVYPLVKDELLELHDSGRVRPPRSTLEVALYPNGGRVPVAGSPADKAGKIPLPLHDVVSMYRQLSGMYPKVVAQRNRGPQNALGWYHTGTGSVAVRAQLFGLVDASDVDMIKAQLRARGLFRNEDPGWCASVSKERQRMEKRISEARLDKALAHLVDQRIKRGVHSGVGTKVLAHELWHALEGMGNDVIAHTSGEIKDLAKIRKGFDAVEFNMTGEMMKEATAFIDWWRGEAGYVERFVNKPEEIRAEMGAALFLDPGAVAARAPKFAQAMMDGLRGSEAERLLDKFHERLVNGTDLDELSKRLRATWSADAEKQERQVRKRLSGKFGKMEAVRVFVDRYGPLVMVVKEAQDKVRQNLKKAYDGGVITLDEYKKRLGALRDQLKESEFQKNLYTHMYGKSKLFLASVGERVFEMARAEGVNMGDVNEYLHLQRVIELKDRATAHGIDAPTARRMLARMAEQGLGKMRRVIKVANAFRSCYEQAVINNRDVQEMLGKDAIDLMKRNVHYVKMKHTIDADTADTLAKRSQKLGIVDDRKDAFGVALDQVRKAMGGGAHGGVGYTLHKLEGSFRATQSPIVATVEEAVAILETAQRNHTLCALADTLKELDYNEMYLLGPGEKAVKGNNHGTIWFMRDGERVGMVVPKPVADAIEAGNHRYVNGLAWANRFVNAGYTTNNPMFTINAYARDLSSFSINNKGVHRALSYYASVFNIGVLAKPLGMLPVPGAKAVAGTAEALLNVGHWISFAAQFVPPHVMKKIGENPIGRLLFNDHTVEYWTSYGHKAAQIVRHGTFEKTLQDARAAREAGDEAKARELEYCARMAREALEDGVLLTMVQHRKDDDKLAHLDELFKAYGLNVDDDPKHAMRRELLQKNLPVSLMKKYWNWVGGLSECEAMTVKLAGYCWLRSKPEVSRRDAALQTVDRIGDPDYSRKGMAIGMLEMFMSPFYNARKEGTLRSIRAFKAAPKDWSTKALVEGVLPTLVRLMIFSGTLGALLLKACGKKDRSELDGTMAGELYDSIDWYRKAYRNVSPYKQDNYHCMPVWMSEDGRATLTLDVPIADEVRPMSMATIALWNRLGLDSTNPAKGVDDAVISMVKNILPDITAPSSAIQMVQPILGLLMGENPYEQYRESEMFDEQEFLARWMRPNAWQSAGAKTWNASPFGAYWRFRDKSAAGAVPEDLSTLADILQIPLVSRFATLNTNGVEQRLNQYVQMDRAQQAVQIMDMESLVQDYINAGDGQPPPLPPEILKDPEMLDAFLKRLRKGSVNQLLKQTDIPRIKKAQKIKDEALKQKAFDDIYGR